MPFLEREASELAWIISIDENCSMRAVKSSEEPRFWEGRGKKWCNEPLLCLRNCGAS
jgi:hypothetical protein